MNGINKELVEVLKDGTSISSIYNGVLLVWCKSKPIDYTKLMGKFLDNSTESNWWYYINGSANNNNKVNIEADNITKEFNIDAEIAGNCGYMFFYNSKLERIDNIPITDKVTNMQKMFSWCENMTSINASNWDLSEVTLINGLFEYCSKLTSIDVSNWKFPKLKYMVGVFESCSSLQSLDVSNWDMSNITSVSTLFHNCSSLTSLDISAWDKSKFTNISSIFYGCEKLETLNLGDWDWSGITQSDYPFAFCNKLKYVTGNLSGISNNISLNVSPLTNESAMIFINGLAEVSTSKTITFKATTYNTLTDEQKAIATNKGWTIKSA